MTFDFFNTSDLAFGNKLTTAFKQLFNKREQAEDNIDSVLEKQAIYSDYFFKNYIVGEPTNATQPCRTNEILNLIKNINDAIDVNILFTQDITTDNDILTINANVYDKTLNIVSKITASKSLGIDDWGFNGTVARRLGKMLSYYLFFVPADSNMSMITKCRLSETNNPEEGEELLFKIYIYPSLTFTKFTVSHLNKKYSIPIGNFSGYKTVSLSNLVSSNTTSPTYHYDAYFKDTIVNTGTSASATTIKCMVKGTASRDFILGVRLKKDLVIKVNGATRYDVQPKNMNVDTYMFVVLKKGDIIDFDTTESGILGNSTKGLNISRLSTVSYEEGASK